MRPAFYDSPQYKEKQANLTKKQWLAGAHIGNIKPVEKRSCVNSNCVNVFVVKPYDPKKYCSRACAALVNNHNRIQSEVTRHKISSKLKDYPSPFKGIEKVPRVLVVCQNPNCAKEFKAVQYLARVRKFCSNACAMSVIGSKTTSPKASKGKPGVRVDVHPSIVFYSTWEANIARVFNLVGIKWKYAPKIFDLGKHTYRPDFYLQEDDIYIEVKNFMGEYSLRRDLLFREMYPKVELRVLGKDEYKQIEAEYKTLIDNWE